MDDQTRQEIISKRRAKAMRMADTIKSLTDELATFIRETEALASIKASDAAVLTSEAWEPTPSDSDTWPRPKTTPRGRGGAAIARLLRVRGVGYR